MWFPKIFGRELVFSLPAPDCEASQSDAPPIEFEDETRLQAKKGVSVPANDSAGWFLLVAGQDDDKHRFPVFEETVTLLNFRCLESVPEST
jgi:hypothetical protein